MNGCSDPSKYVLESLTFVSPLKGLTLLAVNWLLISFQSITPQQFLAHQDTMLSETL